MNNRFVLRLFFAYSEAHWSLGHRWTRIASELDWLLFNKYLLWVLASDTSFEILIISLFASGTSPFVLAVKVYHSDLLSRLSHVLKADLARSRFLLLLLVQYWLMMQFHIDWYRFDFRGAALLDQAIVLLSQSC